MNEATNNLCFYKKKSIQVIRKNQSKKSNNKCNNKITKYKLIIKNKMISKIT